MHWEDPCHRFQELDEENSLSLHFPVSYVTACYMFLSINKRDPLHIISSQPVAREEEPRSQS